MSFIKQQSDKKTKQKLFGLNGWDFQKKDNTTISVI